MADEKLNTGPAENISPEAAEPIATPEQAAASEPQQEQTGPTFRGLSITPAGMWAGWEPRGSITSVRRPVLPNPVIWCSSKAPMTRRA